MRILEQVFFERAGIYRRSASLFEGLNAAYMIKMTVSEKDRLDLKPLLRQCLVEFRVPVRNRPGRI